MKRTFCNRCDKPLPDDPQQIFVDGIGHSVTVKGTAHTGKKWDDGDYCPDCIIAIVRIDVQHAEEGNKPCQA